MSSSHMNRSRLFTDRSSSSSVTSVDSATSPPIKQQRRSEFVKMDDTTEIDEGSKTISPDEFKQRYINSLPTETPPWAKAGLGNLSLQIYDVKLSVNKAEQAAAAARSWAQIANDSCKKVDQKCETVQAEVKKYREENHELSEKITRLEIQMRKKNLCFEGFPEAKDEDCYKKVAATLRAIGIEPEDISADACYRKGKYQPRAKFPRPILAKFVYEEDRNRIFENRFELKGKKVLQHKIFIEEDFPPDVENNCRVLKPIMIVAKRDEALKNRIQLRADKLIIDGKLYRANDVNSIPEPFSLRKNCEIHSDRRVVFFGRYSPFSNHHPCQFEVGGKQYSCGEQFLMSEMALLFKDTQSADKIMQTVSPVKMIALGHQVKNFNQETWEAKAVDLVQRGLREKFRQNSSLLNSLLQTGTREIVEGNGTPSFWGSTLSVEDPTTVDKPYEGDNNLGKILMRIRANLKPQ